MLIKTILIDDEELSIELLSNMLRCTQLVQIIGTARCLTEGSKLIKEKQPQLVFLDINMSGENGFDLLEMKDRDFEVIIASGFDYALTAFKMNATDYLLKPVDPDDLTQALNKVQKRLAQKTENKHNTKVLQDDSPKIAVPSKGGVSLIRVSDIVRCEGMINYTRIYHASGNVITCSKTLLEFEKMLVKHNFFRIHKSHLINLSYVQGFTRGNAPYVILNDSTNLQVSRRHKDELFKLLQMVSTGA